MNATTTNQASIQDLCAAASKAAANVPRISQLSLGAPAVLALRDRLVELYPTGEDAGELLRAAKLCPGDYDLGGSIWLVWGEILIRSFGRCELDAILATLAAN